MMMPPGFNVVRGQVFEALAWTMLALALLAAPTALAGDRPGPDTTIVSGPDSVTTSTTADFVLTATVAQRPEFWCRLDDEADFQPCTDTPQSSDKPHYEGLTPGEHYFAAYAYDPDTRLWDTEPADYLWVVVEGPPPLDAGTPDGGAVDAGGPGEDAGSQDAGSPDAGSSGGGDAGSQDAGSSGGEDAGSQDAGSGGEDAGSGGEDAGSSGGEDAGGPGPDAGSSTEDAGPGHIEDAGSPGGDPTDAGTEDGGLPPDDAVPPEALDYLGGGVGCTGAPAPGAVAGLLLLAFALRRRRR